MEECQITEDFLRSIDIHTVLPQQEPFVMVGTMVHFELGTSTTETVISPSNIFVRDGEFTAPGIMENIAQTCASRIGFYNKYILHKDVQIGFIGAIRDYVVNRLPSVGSTIVTTVDVLEEVFGMTLASATVVCEGETVATAQIKLAVKNIQG